MPVSGVAEPLKHTRRRRSLRHVIGPPAARGRLVAVVGGA